MEPEEEVNQNNRSTCKPKKKIVHKKELNFKRVKSEIGIGVSGAGLCMAELTGSSYGKYGECMVLILNYLLNGIKTMYV